VYISSADWMPRNMTQRIEQAVLIQQKNLKKRLIDNLNLYLSDNQNRWTLDANGTYHRVERSNNDSTSDASETAISAQTMLLNQLCAMQ